MLNGMKKYQIVSFDVFDTLIKRNVNKPSDVFQLVQNRFKCLYGCTRSIKSFKKVRIDAERMAREHRTTEICIEDIYEILNEKYGAEIANKYKELELEVECDICVANQEIKPVFDRCIREKIHVIIVTDMYLPYNIIKKILEKNGYKGYSHIYLSSEVGKMKANGELFDYVIEKEHVAAKHFLHVGDNLKADIKNAALRGMKTMYVSGRKKKKRPFLCNDITGVLQNYVNNTIKKGDIFYSIGYSCFGPLLFGFADWIKQECKTGNCKKVFFLSRDGYVMKNAFDQINDAGIKSEYMYASRRALQVAAICLNPDYESVMKSMFLPRKVKIGWIIKKWGLNPKDYAGNIEKAGIRSDSEFLGSNVITDINIKKLYNDIKNDIIRNSEKEYEALCRYLKKIDFYGNVAIVDIGWYGNMQNALMKVIQDSKLNISLTGYYLGIIPDSVYQKKYNMHGYLFDAEKNSELFINFKYLNTMMEIFFMAPHGSTKRYILDNGIPKVELYDFEYEGTFTKKAVDAIQNGAMEFIHGFSINMYKYEKNDPKIYLNNLYSIFMRPSLNIANNFGELEIWDDKWIKMAPKTNIVQMIIHPKHTVVTFLNVSWKMGYLKRIFKISISYEKLIFLIRGKYKKWENKGD